MKNTHLPTGWQEVKLGDICSINVSSLKENTNENFKFKYIDLSAVKNGIIDFPNDYITFKNAPSRARRIIKIYDVIMATVRPNLKGFAYISFDPEEYICSTGFAVLTSKSEISMKYVYQNLYANYIEKQIFNMLVGSNYPALNTSDILNIKILLPPLYEQKRIAEILSLCDEVIENLNELIEKKELYKKGVMQKLLSGEVRFNGFYDEWKTKKLSEISSSIKTGKLDANAMEENGKYRFYTCAKEYYKINKYAFDGEALLISGNGANVGYIHYYDGKFNAYQRTYVLMDFKENIKYIKYYLDRYLKSRIEKEKNEGNTPYIVLSTLTDMKIKVPSLEEQKKIAEFLSAIDEDIENLKKQLELRKKQKKGLMQRLLTGEVRI